MRETPAGVPVAAGTVRGRDLCVQGAIVYPAEGAGLPGSGEPPFGIRVVHLPRLPLSEAGDAAQLLERTLLQAPSAGGADGA